MSVAHAAESAVASSGVKKHFNIAISNESFPNHFVDIHGEPAGIMVDYWRLWAELQGVNVNFVAYDWLTSLSAVNQGQVDFHAGMTISAPRRMVFDFPQAIFEQSSYVYLHKDMPTINDIEKLSPFTIGVVKGAVHANSLIAQNDKVSLREFDSRIRLYKAALAGEIVAFAELDKLEQSYDKLADLNEKFPSYHRVSFFSGNIGAAVPKGKKALIRFIEQGIAKISVAQREAIKNKWTSIIPQTDAINIVFTSKLPPYMGVSPAGNPQGLFIDIWRLWSQVMGIDVNFIPETMARSVQLIKQQEADVHLAYPEQVPSKTGLKMASHVYSSSSKVFVAKRLGDIKDISELNGHTIAMFPTSPYLERFKKEHPEINVRLITSHQQMLQLVESGDVDGMVTEVENMMIKLVQANLQSSFNVLSIPSYKIDLFSLVHPDNPQLAKIIEEGFKRLPLKQLQEIEANWLSNSSHAHFHRQLKKLNFTLDEINYIAEQSSLTLGVVANWAPIEFVDKQGNVQGITNDIMQLVAEQAGLTLDVRTYDNFKLLLEAFGQGEVDVISGLPESVEQQARYAFTQGYMQMPWAVIHSRYLDSENSINDFYGKRLAIVKDYHFISDFRVEHPQINLSVVDSLEQGLLAVQQGLVDGLVESLPVASKLAVKESVVPLAVSIISELPVESAKFAVHKDKQLLLSIFNKTLASIDNTAKEQIFNNWFDIKIQTGWDKRFVVKVGALVSLFIFIIVLIIAVWNRRLVKEVKLRKQLEEKMKHIATHDELTGVANRALLKQQMEKAMAMHQRQQLKMAVLFVDLDGFKEVNDSFGHSAGDRVLVDVARRMETCVRQSDVVARFGGDEFVILVTGLTTKKEATYVAQKILSAIRIPFNLERGQVSIGSSIGIAVYPDDGGSEADILKVADNLMYRVKTAEKNNYCIM